jgi:hypothetical protein
MSLSKKLDKLIKSSLDILPVRIDAGILVGNVLIESQGFIKNIYKKEKLIYSNINLNLVAIKLANLLAKGNSLRCDQIYSADQVYGKWLNDSQLLRAQHERAKKKQDFERADVLWAKYVESRDRTILAKTRAEALTKI